MAGDILRKEGLPTTTPIYRYQDVEQCLRDFELESKRSRAGSYIIFDHVDRRTFQECFKDDSADSLLQHSFKTYHFSAQAIVLTMTVTNQHEAAHREFAWIFENWTKDQESRLIGTGGASAQGYTREKRADSTWKPASRPPGRGLKWPTVVVESAWSESLAKLKEDSLFWLNESDQEVKVALTIRMAPKGSKTVTIQRWAVDKGSAKCVQAIWVTPNRDPNSKNHQVQGSLKIPFADCFLRARRNDETNFFLSHDDMVMIGEAVWAVWDE